MKRIVCVGLLCLFCISIAVGCSRDKSAKPPEEFAPKPNKRPGPVNVEGEKVK